MDHLKTIHISYTAPWHQRHRYVSTITLACNDEDRQAAPMKARRDFKSTTKILASLRQERGRQNSFIPKNEMVDWVYSKTQILIVTLRIQNQPREVSHVFSEVESNIRPHWLDVQETDVNIPQFYRIRNHFVGCWTANGWITCS